MQNMIKSVILAILMVNGNIGSAYVSANNSTERPSMSDEKDEIRAMMQRWLTAYNARNIEDLIALYSTDIYYANNGSDLQRDLDDLRRGYEASFMSPVRTEISFMEELVGADEKTGYIAGKYRVAIDPPDSSVTYAYGRVLLIFERANGRSDWKLVVDFDNAGPDILSADF